MRILVVGAGGIGGYFGALLATAGRDVTFLVRAARREKLLENGLKVYSPTLSIHLERPTTRLSSEVSDEFDLVIVSCKAYDLQESISDFAVAVGENTLILPLLNGMRHLERLEERFGPEKVLGGLCVVSTSLKDDGSIIQLNDSQSLTLGERNGIARDKVSAVANCLAGADFEVIHSANIAREMWAKWVFIASGAALTSLMRAPIGDIMEAGGQEIAETILAECSAIAGKHGYPLDRANFCRMRTIFTTPGSQLTASLYRDIEQGYRIEAEHILGDLLRRDPDGDSPLLQIAYVHLKTYEARRSRMATV